MSNVKGFPVYVECSDYPPPPFRGTMHGYVRMLAKSPYHKTASFFLNDRQFQVNRHDLPDWVDDGAHIQVEAGESQTKITLINPARQ